MTGDVDLMHELIAAQADSLTDAALTGQGITDAAIKLHCGLTQIDADTTGRFYQPVADGAPAIIVPVLDAEELVDLLAFDPRRPKRWWLRVGAVPLLGGDELAYLLLGPKLFAEPLWVRRTPLGWLRNSCRGVVILDFVRALADLSAAPNGIVAEDGAHQREIKDRLSRVVMERLPNIIVRGSEGREAA